MLGASVGTREQRVPPVERDRADGALDGVVVEFDATVIDEARQAFPARQGIADGRSKLAFLADQAEFCAQSRLEPVDQATARPFGAPRDFGPGYLSRRRRVQQSVQALSWRSVPDQRRRAHRSHAETCDQQNARRTSPRSAGTSLRRASQFRTSSSKASTAGCARVLNETLFFGLDDARNSSANGSPTTTASVHTLIAEIPDARDLCRCIHRNGRSAALPRPAPPIASCFNRAGRRTKP
jgi:hypothetical protein